MYDFSFFMKREKITGDQLRRIMNGEEILDDEGFDDNIFQASEKMRERREELEKGVDLTPEA